MANTSIDAVKSKDLLQKTRAVIENMDQSLLCDPMEPQNKYLFQNLRQLAEIVECLIEDHVGWNDLDQAVGRYD